MLSNRYIGLFNKQFLIVTICLYLVLVNTLIQPINCQSDQDKLLVQRVKTTVNTISLQWLAPKKIAITSGLRPPQMMVYHYLLANGSEPLNSHNIPWSSKGVKIGLSSDQSTGSAIIENLRPNNKYLVKVEDDKMNETLIVETKDGCFHNSSIYAIGDRFNISCDQICICQTNSTIKCSDRCQTKTDTLNGPNCITKPDPKDPECCLVTQCEGEVKPMEAISEARPKVLVTSKTRTSVAFAWDDFKLPNYESGYVIEYKPVDNSSLVGVNNPISIDQSLSKLNVTNDTMSRSDWIQVQGNNTPFWTLEGLQPGSSYIIRIGLWEYPFDERNKKIDSSDQSEMIIVTTEEGCIKDNASFPLGKQIVDGCESRCTCQSGNLWDCRSVCKEPFISKGTNMDPSCTETPVDECCSSLNCIETRSEPPTNSSEDVLITSPPLTQPPPGSAEIAFSDKPGHCYEPTRIRSETGLCLEECQHDYHCRGLDKCCPTACGGSVCSEANTKSPKRCESLVCGQNTLCLDNHSDLDPPKCACKPGYRGDPYDLINGCRRVNSRSNLICDYKNKTYGPREEFFDGCDFKCICSEALEVECNPRCPFIGSDEPVTTVDPLCTIIQDPKDPCCKTIACESKPVDVVRVNSSQSANSPIFSNGEPVGDTVSVDAPLPVSGCRYENITYQPGESFVNGCESRCICKEGYHLQCAPRCPVFHGYNQKLCSLIPDPDDPECCKIAVCDTEKVSPNVKKMDPFNLILDSAKATNSTHILLRLIIPNSIHHKSKHVFLIRYSKVDSQVTPSSSNDPNSRAWSNKEVSEDDLKLLEPGMFEIDFNGLLPSTEYFVEVKEVKSNSTSNTVFIKTFPEGVDSSFNGCFFNNQIIQVGQEFYDGCEYKCVCGQGGTRECEDRCPIYIDTIGFEECDWVPSPEDPCCTIPVCSKNKDTNEKDEESIKNPIDNSNEPSMGHQPVPSSTVRPNPSTSSLPVETVEPFCLGKDNRLHFIGEAWDESGPGGCLKQTCRCVQLSNGTTTTRCHGGCPPIPPNTTKPSPGCPKPFIITPSDPCLCPYLICDHSEDEPIQSSTSSIDQQNHSSSSTPQPTLASSEKPFIPDTNPGFCLFKSRTIPVGQFNDGCESVCECFPNGKVSCGPLSCPQFFDAPNEKCLEWELDPNFIPEPPNCCPRPTCKNDGSCIFAGLRFPNFKPIPNELLPCGTRCVCMNTNVTCENRCPPISETPPPNLPCPLQMAYRGHLPGDDCCLHWMCRDSERSVFCIHNGNRYKVGDQWEDVNPSNVLGPRRRCSCKPTPPLGKPQVDCFGGICPKITERHLKPSAECPLPVLISPEDPVLCPYVICNYSEETGKELENVSVVAMNNSAVRIRFTLPSLFVGLIGHAEVHFTTDPNIQRHQWNVQKFARPKRLFDTANIEYHLGGLKPDTTYYFQVRILIEALHSGPESQIYKLYLPAPGSSVSGSHGYPLTSSTLLSSSSVSSPIPFTSSSTLPPQVTMDVELHVVAIDGTTAKLSWRKLEPREKSLIDGITIKYRLTTDPFDKWITTPMIHRDVNEYTLRDLKSGLSYVVDLILRPAESLQTQLLSAKPVTIEMPARPNEFDFVPSIDVTPESYRTMIKLRGLPRPTDKYVNVVKVNFREANSEGLENKMVHMFKTPSEDGTVIVDGLRPNNRYKAWMDLYLANGATLSTNTVTFNTKEDLKPVINENRDDDPSANEAEALKESSSGEAIKPYYIALMIVAIFAIITGIGFVTLLCVLMKTKTCAKAAITRAPSEAAYDNPTYKTYDGEKPGEEPMKHGSA